MGRRPSTKELLEAYKICRERSLQGDDFMACLVKVVREKGDKSG